MKIRRSPQLWILPALNFKYRIPGQLDIKLSILLINVYQYQECCYSIFVNVRLSPYQFSLTIKILTCTSLSKTNKSIPTPDWMKESRNCFAQTSSIKISINGVHKIGQRLIFFKTGNWINVFKKRSRPTDGSYRQISHATIALSILNFA